MSAVLLNIPGNAETDIRPTTLAEITVSEPQLHNTGVHPARPANDAV
ncbi:MAG: hypothetical protein HOI35_12210 [Woeseia sp.]|nr:hypothetical protein [Woeseia sp.]